MTAPGRRRLQTLVRRRLWNPITHLRFEIRYEPGQFWKNEQRGVHRFRRHGIDAFWVTNVVSHESNLKSKGAPIGLELVPQLNGKASLEIVKMTFEGCCDGLDPSAAQLRRNGCAAHAQLANHRISKVQDSSLGSCTDHDGSSLEETRNVAFKPLVDVGVRDRIETRN